MCLGRIPCVFIGPLQRVLGAFTILSGDSLQHVPKVTTGRFRRPREVPPECFRGPPQRILPCICKVPRGGGRKGSRGTCTEGPDWTKEVSGFYAAFFSRLHVIVFRVVVASGH